MQVIVPYAAAQADDARRALAGLRLPALAAFVARSGPPQRDDGDDWSLSPPHERAFARALGYTGADGCLPWAAQAAAEAGLATGNSAWGLLEPVHWRVGSDEVGLVDPAALELQADESRALFDAVAPLVTSAGYGFVWLDALRWLLVHESLRGLPTAAIERAIGRDVERWLPRTATAWSRLHSEVQMSWYRDSVNDKREARGAWPVNALWLSGCGARQAARNSANVKLDERLRAPALAGDWQAWAAAWLQLDKEVIAPLLADGGTLTLCGERSSATLEAAPGWWPRFRGSLRGASVAPLLQSL